MAYSIPVTEPVDIVRGDTIQWTRSLTDYPASDGWVLTYYFTSSSGNRFSVVATAIGADHSITIPAASSAAFTVGRWSWQASVAKGAERFTVGSGLLTIAENFAGTSAPLDTRTHARKCLEIIEAALENRLPDNLDSYNIGGVDIRHVPLKDLYLLRQQYKAEVIAEDQVAGGGRGRNILIRFNRP